jgi:hypothetical protein
MPDTLHSACQTEKTRNSRELYKMSHFLPAAECEILGIFTMFWGSAIPAVPRCADFARMGPSKPL